MPTWGKIVLGIGIALITLIALIVGGAFWFMGAYLTAEEFVADPAQPVGPQALAYLERLHEARQFNGVVLIRKDGELSEAAYGIADADGVRDLTLDMPMRLGSVSKPFTATAILTLVREREIDLDAPLSDYLPECQQLGVTVRHLLGHTSAIPDNYMSLAKAGDLVTIERVIEHSCAQESAGVPGRDYAYSNTGYVLLAGIVERVSGQSFEEAMDARVFEPLGLSNTRVWNRVSPGYPQSPSEAGVAGTIDFLEDPPVDLTMGVLDGVAGDGAVHASARDLLTFAESWRTNVLLPGPLRAEAMTDGPGDYGLGWVIVDEVTLGHNGSWLGASSELHINLATGDALILIENGNNLRFGSIAAKLRRAVFPISSETSAEP